MKERRRMKQHFRVATVLLALACLSYLINDAYFFSGDEIPPAARRSLLAVEWGKLLRALGRRPREEPPSRSIMGKKALREQYQKEMALFGPSMMYDKKIEPVPPPPEEFTVCGRAAGSHLETSTLQHRYEACPPRDPGTPILVLAGYATFGRTGNQLKSFLRAVQYARDEGMRLGVIYSSWATATLLKFFFADGNGNTGIMDGGGGEWRAKIERELCVEVFYKPEELKGQKVVLKSQEWLLKAKNRAPYDEFVASQLHVMRTLFKNANMGEGRDPLGNAPKDMCSGIDALFGENRASAVYSVVHLRSLEGGGGISILGKVAKRTGCDPTAALAMEPSYVKSILEPLGMLDHPIVVVTDGQNKVAMKRLEIDPDLGPMVRRVPEEACWFGGDVMLSVMANVFIGNPASTMSGFMARSRVALGRGNNHMYRARDEHCRWTTACGDNCLFRYPRGGPYASGMPPGWCQKIKVHKVTKMKLKTKREQNNPRAIWGWTAYERGKKDTSTLYKMSKAKKV